MELDAYLRLCYRYVSGSYTHNSFGKLVLLQLCRNHWQKMMAMNLKHHTSNKKKKYLILEGIACLLEVRSWEDFLLKLRAFFALLLSKRVYKVTSAAAQTLLLGTRTEQDVAGTGPDPEDIEEENYNMQERLNASPFFEACYDTLRTTKEELKAARDEITTEEDSLLTKNPAYCPRFLKDYFLTRCAAIIPLWTQIMTDCRGKGIYLPASNADGEGYFKLVKSEERILHDKLGRWIDAELKYIENKLIKVDRKLITSSKIYRKYANREKEQEEAKPEPKSTTVNADVANIFLEVTSSTVSDVQVASQGKLGESQQESWKAHLFSSKKKHSYFDGRQMKKCFPHSDAEGRKPRKKNAPSANLSNEAEKELWRSPPAVNTKAITMPTAAKNASRQKDSAKKMIQEAFEKSDSHHESSGPPDSLLDIIYVAQDPPENELEKTYYSRYTTPPKTILSSVPFTSKLTGDEVEFLKRSCRCDASRPVLLYGDFDRYLCLGDFVQLLDKRELSNATVDAALFCLEEQYGRPKICVLSATEGTEIFCMKYCSTLSVNRREIQKFSVVLIPYLMPGHWVLCYVDLRGRKFQLLDPAGPNPATETELLQICQDYLLQHTRRSFQLRHSDSITYEPQNCYVSCGVYVLQFIESILKDEVIHLADPIDARITIAKMILAKSKDELEESEIQAKTAKLRHPRYDNGLFTSVQHYVFRRGPPSALESMVICCFGEGIPHVRCWDLSNLVNGNWISGNVIDAAFHIAMHDSDRLRVVNVRCRESQSAVYGFVDEFNLLTKINISGKILIMPHCVKRSHWCLVVADTEKKKYRYLDPLKKESSSHLKKEFLSFLSKRNQFTTNHVDCRSWTTDTSLKVPKQTDLINCGLFVIHYGYMVIRGQRTSDKFDPNAFRKTLARDLLRKCPSMRHLCLHCGYGDYNTSKEIIGQMVQCSGCRRWMHKRCDPKLKGTELEIIQGDDFTFYCVLCQRYESRSQS